MTATTQASSTQTYTLFIAAEPERVWQAPTDPDRVQRYFNGVRIKVAGAGWMLVLSGLKTLLETGRPLGAA
jgi:uncharacterized protein YndB with AHSA1/START domain